MYQILKNKIKQIIPKTASIHPNIMSILLRVGWYIVRAVHPRILREFIIFKWHYGDAK